MKKSLIFSAIMCCFFNIVNTNAQDCSPVDKNVAQAVSLLVGRDGISNPDSAVVLLKQYAAQGNSMAIHALGLASLKGLGMEQNTRQAISLLEEAGNGGYANAWMNLGLLYESGDGVSCDYTLAKEYFGKAVQGGCMSALYPLGCMAYYGLGQDRDYGDAFARFEESATIGQPESMYMTGVCYEYGTGVIQDIEMAKVWLEAARLNGIRPAALELHKLEAVADSTTRVESLAELRAYPNPFERELTVEFELQVSSKVHVTLSSMSRLNLYVQETELLEPGQHRLTVYPTVPSGIYMLTISANNVILSSTIYKK